MAKLCEVCQLILFSFFKTDAIFTHKRYSHLIKSRGTCHLCTIIYDSIDIRIRRGWWRDETYIEEEDEFD